MARHEVLRPLRAQGLHPCLGNQANAIKSYFLNYSEYESNDFVLSNGGRDVTLLNSDISDWRITFVDTGLKSSVGERLMSVQHLLEDEDWFLANYTDGLTDRTSMR